MRNTKKRMFSFSRTNLITQKFDFIMWKDIRQIKVLRIPDPITHSRGSESTIAAVNFLFNREFINSEIINNIILKP